MHSGPLTSGYAGVAYGTLGTTANMRLSRAGHSLHLPLHLSDHYQDWRTLLFAVTVPMIVNLAVTQRVPSLPTPHSPGQCLSVPLSAAPTACEFKLLRVDSAASAL